MNLKLIESFVELIELGAFANKKDIVKGLNSAIKVTKEQAELTDEEIEEIFAESCTDFKLLENGKTKGVVNIIDVGRAILRKAQEK
jgi:hypothetical protein